MRKSRAASPASTMTTPSPSSRTWSRSTATRSWPSCPTFERLSLKRSLDFPEDSAGRRMQTDFIAIPPFWTVGQTIDYLRREADLPDEFFQIYVVDAAYQVLGTIALDKFLRAQRAKPIEELMNTNFVLVEPTRTRKRQRATSSATTWSKSAWWTRAGGSSASSPSTTSST